MLKTDGYQIGYIGKYHVGKPDNSVFDVGAAYPAKVAIGKRVDTSQPALAAEQSEP